MDYFGSLKQIHKKEKQVSPFFQPFDKGQESL